MVRDGSMSSFVESSEMRTHLTKAQIKVISEEDETILLSAIDTAISEAKGYLGAYDRGRIFGARGEERSAILVSIVQDMATFHFLKLCNYGADLEFRTFLYQRAIDWLKQVQKGQVEPDLPRLDEDGDGEPDGALFLYGSNPRRTHHF